MQGTHTQSNVASVTIADAAGSVLVSTNPLLVGTALPVGDEAVFDGRGWRGEIEAGGERLLAAQVPVLGSGSENDLGELLGVVMIGQTVPSIPERLGDASPNLLLYLGVASALGVAGSWMLARRIKRQTFGMEPREIAGLAEHREAMLYGIAEGVVALDDQHRITLVNDVGRRLLDLPADPVGRDVADLRLGERLRDVLTGVVSGSDQVVLAGSRVLVVNRMGVVKDGRSLGSVATLRDRTELAQLESDLGSFRSTAEALRAQAHEFDNKLHTISGLIQIGEYDEVVDYIDSLNRHRQFLDLSIRGRVRDNAIAALLMAKSAQASERQVRLEVAETTDLGALSAKDSADVGTVVGNLVDNAVDAAGSQAARTGPDAWVRVEIRQEEAVEIAVTDSGPGVPPEAVAAVFEHGFTTKAAESAPRRISRAVDSRGHGIGLALTKLVCEHHGGGVAVAETGAAPDSSRASAFRPPRSRCPRASPDTGPAVQ
ncbi:ATP-binding protein [Glycomyces albus]